MGTHASLSTLLVTLLLVLPVTLALDTDREVDAPIALSSTAAEDSPGSPPAGLGALDPWVDAQGDTMTGDLNMGTHAILLGTGQLRSSTPGNITYGGKIVCLSGVTTTCVGPQGPAGPQGPIGPQGTIGPQGLQGPQGPAGSVQTVDCGAGNFIRSVSSGGVATCAADANNAYLAGAGLQLSGLTFSVQPNGVTSSMIADGGVASVDIDATQIQRRVAGSCAANQYVRVIAQDGTVTCGADASNSYTAGNGLVLSGSSFALNQNGISTCTVGTNDKIIWDGANNRLTCASDQTNVYSGSPSIAIDPTNTISVASGGVTSSHIQDGAIAAADVNSAEIQRRVSGSCTTGSYVRQVNQDGTVVCETSSGSITPTVCGYGLVLVEIGTGTPVCKPEARAEIPQAYTVDHVVDYNLGDITNLSATLDPDGLPVVSYRLPNGTLGLTRCADIRCDAAAHYWLGGTGVGNTSVVVQASTTGFHNRVSVAYYNSTGSDLYVAACQDPTCAAVNHIALDSTNSVGTFASAALSPINELLVAYADITNGDLRMARCSNPGCSTAISSVIVESTNSVGPGGVSLAINAEGLPVIAYRDNTNGALRVATCAVSTCSSTTAFAATPGPGGFRPSISIGPDGLPVISHNDLATGAFYLTRCSTPTCSSATSTQLSTGTIRASSVAFTATGQPVVALQNVTTGTLEYRHCGITACFAPVRVDTSSPALGGIDPTLILGVDGKMLVVYADNGEDDLKFRHFQSDFAIERHWRRG